MWRKIQLLDLIRMEKGRQKQQRTTRLHLTFYNLTWEMLKYFAFFQIKLLDTKVTWLHCVECMYSFYCFQPIHASFKCTLNLIRNILSEFNFIQEAIASCFIVFKHHSVPITNECSFLSSKKFKHQPYKLMQQIILTWFQVD